MIKLIKGCDRMTAKTHIATGTCLTVLMTQPDSIKYLTLGIAGGVIGFFFFCHVMKKYLKQNPPINEDMIKALMMQMGRKPNQKQINQMMRAMEKYQ